MLDKVRDGIKALGIDGLGTWEKELLGEDRLWRTRRWKKQTPIFAEMSDGDVNTSANNNFFHIVTGLTLISNYHLATATYLILATWTC